MAPWKVAPTVFCAVALPNCSLRAWDAGACAEVGCVQEFMDSYELVAFTPSAGADGGHEVIAGAVHGGAIPVSRSRDALQESAPNADVPATVPHACQRPVARTWLRPERLGHGGAGAHLPQSLALHSRCQTCAQASGCTKTPNRGLGRPALFRFCGTG